MKSVCRSVLMTSLTITPGRQHLIAPWSGMKLELWISMMKLKSVFILSLVFSLTAKAVPPNKTVIVTDLLDDDIRAIVQVLADSETRGSIAAIVVSTGNTELKTAVAAKIVSGLGLTIPVCTGTSTDLASNPVTSFAANYELEGKPILSDFEIEKIKEQNGMAGNGSEKLNDLFEKAVRANVKLNVLLLTAPTDFVKAIKANEEVARTAIGDVFSMGFYKENKNGQLMAPYNTMADPNSVISLLRLYNKGIIERLFHVPSDTIQLRSGLPGGYFPENKMGDDLRERIKRAMEANPILAQILGAAQEYGYNWRHSATQQFGVGLGSGDRWVPSSFQNPDRAAGFYLADTIPAVTAMMSKQELSTLNLRMRKIAGPKFGTNLKKTFQFTEPQEGRDIFDLVEFDGLGTLDKHAKVMEGAVQFSPTKAYYSIATNESKAPKTPNTKDYRRSGKSRKSLVLVFKNSPDDWFALLRMVSTKAGRSALESGGIIAEGFRTQEMKVSLIKFLSSIGVTRIPIAAGHQYSKGEIESIPNFKGELAFVELMQSERAFSTLPMPASSINTNDFSPSEIVKRAAAWADKNSATVDAIVLGEGIDLIRTVTENPELVERIENLYVMGGGRYEAESGKIVLSRNWLPHTQEIIDGLEKFGNAGKKVYVFSSNDFGGSIVSSTEENLGNGKTAFKSLINAAKSHAGMKALENHWINWARTFDWIFQPADKRPTFDANSTVKNVSTSPLGLSIAEQWLLGELETRRSDLRQEEVALANLVANRDKGVSGEQTGVVWLRPHGQLEVVPLAHRFGISVQETLGASTHSEAVRASSIFGQDAKDAWQMINETKKSAGPNCRVLFSR